MSVNIYFQDVANNAEVANNNIRISRLYKEFPLSTFSAPTLGVTAVRPLNQIPVKKITAPPIPEANSRLKCFELSVLFIKTKASTNPRAPNTDIDIPNTFPSIF